MNSYNGTKKIRILLIAILALSTLSTDVFADKIKRSCTGSYYALILSLSYEDQSQSGYIKDVSIPYGDVRTTLTGYDFKAQGSCGRLVPNRCRKRARDKVIDCARAHAKNPNKTPKECLSNKIKNYPFVKLIPTIEKHICKGPLIKHGHGIDVTIGLPTKYNVNYEVGIRTMGNTGCGSKTIRSIVTLDGVSVGGIDAMDGLLYVPLKKFTVTCPK